MIIRFWTIDLYVSAPTANGATPGNSQPSSDNRVNLPSIDWFKNPSRSIQKLLRELKKPSISLESKIFAVDSGPG